jgi:predicted lipoprotein with Yx(FWY)xxD motif
MKKLLGVAAIVAVFTLAACGGGGGGGGSTMAAASAGGGKTVAVQGLGNAGQVLVDSSGHALYASEQEANGMVLCTGGCESFWSPLTIKGGNPSGSVPGTLGVVKRPDGSRQVTYNGMPLYSFTQDGTGEVTGDGFSDAFGGQHFTWHVVSVRGGGSSSAASSGNGAPSAY